MELKDLFKSRVLSRYELHGFNTQHPTCLFYIRETRCICALDTPYRKGDPIDSVPNVHQSEIEASKDEKTQVAWGYPAFLLANCHNISCNTGEEAKNLVASYIRSDVKESVTYEKILNDWQRTLMTFHNINQGNYIDGLRMVGNYIKLLLFADKTPFSLQEDIRVCYACFKIKGDSNPLYAYLIPASTEMGDDAEAFAQMVLVPQNSFKLAFQGACEHAWAAFGFTAVLIQYALASNMENVLRNMDFSRMATIDYWVNAMQNTSVPLVDLTRLDFKFPFSYLDLIKKYLNNSVEPIRNLVSHNPTYPIELSEGDNIYSYILWAEKTAFQVFVANQLYASFTREQQDQLQTFFRRYLEYLSKTYGANEDFMNRINMREYGHIEPLQISLTTHVQVTDKDGKDVTLERARTDGWEVQHLEEKDNSDAHWPYYTPKTTDDDKRIFDEVENVDYTYQKKMIRFIWYVCLFLIKISEIRRSMFFLSHLYAVSSLTVPRTVTI